MSLRELSSAGFPPWGPSVAALASSVRAALRAASAHTGLPVLVIAAVALVVSWRVLKRSARFAFEVAIVAALLLAATRAGWIAW